MKKEFLKGFTVTLVILVIAFASAVVSNAQSTISVVANIPFEFSVGNKALPAGEYTVQTVPSSNSALMVRSANGKSAAIRLTEESDRTNGKAHAHLQFRRYGDRYFLTEVWDGFEPTGRRLLRSQEERAIEGELASIASKSELAQSSYQTIEVLARVR